MLSWVLSGAVMGLLLSVGVGVFISYFDVVSGILVEEGIGTGGVI